MLAAGKRNRAGRGSCRRKLPASPRRASSPMLRSGRATVAGAPTSCPMVAGSPVVRTHSRRKQHLIRRVTMTKDQEPAKRTASKPAPPVKPPKPIVPLQSAKPTRPAGAARPEVVRRRRPGYKLVNGGWVRDPSTARKDQ